MKSPDEIKKGLETCIGECTGNKPHCPYHECGNGCMDTMNRNSLAYITELEQRLAQVERERDAAVKVLEEIASILDVPACSWCKYEPYEPKHCKECRMKNEGFEWRGVCDENSKEGNK